MSMQFPYEPHPRSQVTQAHPSPKSGETKVKDNQVELIKSSNKMRS